VNGDDPLIKALRNDDVRTWDLAEKCPSFIDFMPA